MPGIVSGRAWLSERRRFLQEELAKDPPPQQRTVLEAELATVEQELKVSRGHWWRWLAGFGGGRPPT
jgi:hypothetical protein